MDEVFRFIDQSLEAGKKMLVYCNQGQSPLSGIGLLYLVREEIIQNESFQEAGPGKFIRELIWQAG